MGCSFSQTTAPVLPESLPEGQGVLGGFWGALGFLGFRGGLGLCCLCPIARRRPGIVGVGCCLSEVAVEVRRGLQGPALSLCSNYTQLDEALLNRWSRCLARCCMCHPLTQKPAAQSLVVGSLPLLLLRMAQDKQKPTHGLLYLPLIACPRGAAPIFFPARASTAKQSSTRIELCLPMFSVRVFAE